jgi:hypothetical protein
MNLFNRAENLKRLLFLRVIKIAIPVISAACLRFQLQVRGYISMFVEVVRS